MVLAITAPQAAAENGRIASPRIRALVQEMTQDKAAALERFWQDAKGKCPLVEVIDGDDQHLLVTFLWRGDASLERIEVRGGPFATSREPFARIRDSDVWYHCERLPKDARYVYGLVVKRRVERREDDGSTKQVVVEQYPNDPFNTLQFNQGPVVELPDAPKDAWHIAKESVAKSHVKRWTIKSKTLDETRELSAYVPNSFDSHNRHALAVFFDGEECDKLMDLPVVFDNLIAQKKILPTVAILVDSQGTRGRDLLFSDSFVKFVADELVPWAIDEFGLQVTAKETLIGGMSLGGLTAAYAAHERPEVFGNVLSQSGAFWRARPGATIALDGRGWLPDHVKDTDPTVVRYYLEVGRFEATTMIENNRQLRDVLRAKGNTVTYDEYNGGHDHVNWRVSVGRGLMALLGPGS